MEGAMKQRQKIYRTKTKALQVPKLAQYIMLVDRYVSLLFTHLKKTAVLFTQKKDLRNQLFYVEKSLNLNLANFSALMTEKMHKIVRKLRY